MVQRQACLLDFVPHPVADVSAPFGTLHNFLLLQWHCCMVPRRGCLRLRIKFYFPCFFRSGTSQLLLLFLPPFFLATSGWIRFFFFFTPTIVFCSVLPVKSMRDSCVSSFASLFSTSLLRAALGSYVLCGEEQSYSLLRSENGP